MKYTTLLSVILLTLSFNVHSQCRINYGFYDLVFEENFDNITNINQLSNVWQFHHDDPGWGWGDNYNSETNTTTFGEYYDQSSVSIQPGGILRLSAEKVPGGSTPIWSDWYSAYRYPKYKSGMIQLKKNLFTDTRFDGTNSCSTLT